MQETRVQSLGQEDPLEKEMATTPVYSCLEESVDRGAWRATVHRFMTNSFTYFFSGPCGDASLAFFYEANTSSARGHSLGY